MNNKKTFWISFDLGIKGDYNGMYTWLDSHKAKECGDSVAVFSFTGSKKFLMEIKADIEKSVQLNPTDRIYIIWRDDNENKSKGRFLFGARRTSPWAGYAPKEGVTEEDF